MARISVIGKTELTTAIWEIVQEAYMIPVILDNAIQGEVERYENNYKALNLITTALGMNVYDHVSHLETIHDV
jgi:cobalamin biosynthesis Co2+ chelatase CbiK